MSTGVYHDGDLSVAGGTNSTCKTTNIATFFIIYILYGGTVKLGFYVPPTATVIQRQALSFGLRIPEFNSGHLIYKACSYATVQQRLLNLTCVHIIFSSVSVAE